MATCDNLTNFSGAEGEDALKWYKSFINATSALSERVMLSNFPLYMEPSSPAQIWCDELPKEAFLSWTDLDRHFRRMWLHCGEGKVEAMEQFQNHFLTDDTIFASTDASAMNKVIADWAANHAKLGDAALVQATLPNLPVFIRAFLKYNSSPPTTFKSLCERITKITDPILEFEQLRRQEKSADWQAKMENKRSDDDPKVVESNVADDMSFFLPVESQPMEVSLNKAEMVEIVKEAMGNLRKYAPSAITINAACMIDIGLLYYCNAVKAPGQFRPNTIIGQAGTKSTLCEGILQISHQQDSNGLGGMLEAIKIWDSIVDGSKTIIKEECVYKSNYTQFTYVVDGRAYGIPSQSTAYYGGLAQTGDGSAIPHIGISSFKTALYCLLSGYLADATKDDRHKKAAVDSANWINKWAYNETTRLVKDFTWDINHSGQWKAASLSPHMTGLFIEALCVLFTVTREQKWSDLAIAICDSAMVYRDWHDNNGVFKYAETPGSLLVDHTNAYRGLLIRGLLVAYQRNLANETLRHKIRSYVNVQFSGLRKYAYNRGSYGMNWNGPYVGPSVDADIAALDVLMAAVVVNHY